MHELWKWESKSGISYITIPHWAEQGVINGFSGRTGGISEPPYSELNLALHVGDNPGAVMHNRRLWLGLFGLEMENGCCCRQVHGNEVVVVEPGLSGRGMSDYESSIENTDAMICKHDSVALLSYYADCMPLMFYDPLTRSVAQAHAGWKGTYLGIAGKTVEKMNEQFGSDPRDIEAFIGPGIGVCCFKISDELGDKVAPSLPNEGIGLIQRREGSCYWDLRETNRMQLIAAGICPEKIISSNLCTSCHTELFYSHRFEKGHTGRMAALISIARQ